MIRFVTRLSFAAALFVVFPATAGEAEICYGAEVALGTVSAPTNDTEFSCPQAGDHTLPELAELGWSVVQMLPMQVTPSTQAIQLVIQKP